MVRLPVAAAGVWSERSGRVSGSSGAAPPPAASGDDSVRAGEAALGQVAGARFPSSRHPLAREYDCAVLDLDGVVYVGDAAVPGAPERLLEAREAGMRLAYVTNNASRPPATVAEHLRSLGVPADDTDVVTSAQAAAREIADRVAPGSAVLVVGGEGLVQAVRERDLVPLSTSQEPQETPAAVVQGFGREVGWADLARATYAVRAGALWVASNLDLTVPTADGIAPGNGTLVQAVATALGRAPDVVAGKPYRPLFDETARRVGAVRPLVVGDRLDTDIAGAVRWGADSLLVMTGITDLTALASAPRDERPTYVGWTLASLLTAHRAAQQTATGSWRLDDWELQAAEGRVDVARWGADRDQGLRVLAAAAWDWYDSHGGSSPLDLRVLQEAWSRD